MFVMLKIEVQRYSEGGRYPMLFNNLFRLGKIAHRPQAERHFLFELLPFDNRVQEPVFEEERGALEPLWQILANGLLYHPRPCESNEGIGLSDVDVTEHSE